MLKLSKNLVTGAALIDSLEPRRLLAALAITPYEQYMLELVNRARLNPSAEASRQGIALNEGLADGTLSTNARQPLANNLFLNDAARSQAYWLMANNLFQHSGSGNSSPADRMIAAGYTFGAGSGSSENLALTLGSSLGDLTARIETLFNNLFIDSSIVGRGHRLNLLNPSHKEMGSGVTSGPYTYNGSNWTGILAAQNFAFNGGNPFLTGVAFNDTIRTDNFYTPGEAMPTVTVTATAVDGTVYTTTTAVAGGYSMRVPSGVYTITASWNAKVKTYANVFVGSENVKRDFKQSSFAAPPAPDPDPDPQQTVNAFVDNGLLWITGTRDDDVIEVTVVGNNVRVRVGENAKTFSFAQVTDLFIEGMQGDDFITVGEGLPAATVVGGEGNDTIIGASTADSLYGSDGNDSISAGSGNDTVFGGLGNDNINGGGGRNTLNGEEGNDRLNGSGGVDRLYGGAGNDRLYGQSGDDFLDGGGHLDRLYGGAGNDTLNGGSSNDRLYGDAGNDFLIGSSGRDAFRGGTDNDEVLDRETGELLEEIEVG